MTNTMRKATAAVVFAFTATTLTAAPATAAPATTVYYDTKSCKATTALDPRLPDYTNLVQIQYTRPDRVGSGRGVYLKAVSVLPGSTVAKIRLRITSHEVPRRETTHQYYDANRQWKTLPTPPETSRRRVTKVNVRTAIMAAGDREVTACTIEITK